MPALLDVGVLDEWTPSALDAFLRAQHSTDLDWRRFEIVDGQLVVSPQPTVTHAHVVDELTATLRGSVPDDLHVSGAIGVRFGRTYRVTDVTVVRRSAFRGATTGLDPADVLLAVEVESPSSITTDRITKPAQYAAVGIPHYWRVETGPLRLCAYRLVDEVYVETGAWMDGEVAILDEPYPVRVEIGSLLPR